MYAVIISQNTYLWILQAKCEPNKGYRRVHCHGFQKLLQNKRCCQEMIYNITRNPILNENLYISVAQSNSCKTQGHFLLVQCSYAPPPPPPHPPTPRNCNQGNKGTIIRQRVHESNRTFWFVRFIFSSWKARMKGQKTFILTANYKIQSPGFSFEIFFAWCNMIFMINNAYGWIEITVILAPPCFWPRTFHLSFLVKWSRKRSCISL